jgi:integrase
MGSITPRNGVLWFDFRYQDRRCRETSRLPDTPAARRTCETALKKIEAEITLGRFDYAKWFPSSGKVQLFHEMEARRAAHQANTPDFASFAELWYREISVEWRATRATTVRDILDRYLIPRFGALAVSCITKEQILAFRADLSITTWARDKTKLLSPVRINHILLPLHMILEEAADRFNFTSPWRKIKPLKQSKSEVEPFTLPEVKAILERVRPDFRPYYTVRFFTGLRSSEIDGLRWRYVDFDAGQILVREAFVHGQMVSTKTDGSRREVAMNRLVIEALRTQWDVSGDINGFVFPTLDGNPFEARNIIRRVWRPLLRNLGLRERRPYQTRHTAATLWLAAGENPEWIARQMGHSSTQMLFRVYSRFVPNLTRQDGSAFDKIVEAHFGAPAAEDDSADDEGIDETD